jgi:hypothetical protein
MVVGASNLSQRTGWPPLISKIQEGAAMLKNYQASSTLKTEAF